MEREKLDEIIGVVRCARCGHRLEGEIECPFCSMFPDPPVKSRIPKWIFFTACFLTSPLSLYVIVTTRRLRTAEKILASSGFLLWSVLYVAW